MVCLCVFMSFLVFCPSVGGGFSLARHLKRVWLKMVTAIFPTNAAAKIEPTAGSIWLSPRSPRLRSLPDFFPRAGLVFFGGRQNPKSLGVRQVFSPSPFAKAPLYIGDRF